MGGDEVRDGVTLTNLGQPLFDGAEATKRDLVEYLDAVSDRFIPVLRDRPLSVIRVLRGQAPFMQKNVPKYTPPWVPTVSLWAEASRREVTYALCNDRRTLLWFANQRAVEFHPALVVAGHWAHPTHLILDIDPPEGGPFGLAVQAALLTRQALADAGMAGAVKTSGAKGLHVFVPLTPDAAVEEVAAATPALAARSVLRVQYSLLLFAAQDVCFFNDTATTEIYPLSYTRPLHDALPIYRGGKVFLDATRAGGATVAAAYSPRIRPGVPVSFPVAWDDLDRVASADFTVHTAPALLAAGDPWADQMPPPQRLSPGLIAEGHTIPIARVQAMHEGKRRARARRQPG